MNVPLLIAGRYLRSSESHGYSSVVTTVSFFGLVLGVVALMTVVSVMNGFDRELKSRILGAIPHIIVENVAEPALQQYTDKGDIDGLSSFQDTQVLVLSGRGNLLLNLYGVSPDEARANVSLSTAMLTGSLSSLTPSGTEILLGRSAARRLGLQPGDALTLVVPTISESGKVLRPVLKTVNYVGAFSLGSELDYLLGVMHVDGVAALKGQPPAIRVTMSDVLAAPAFAEQLRQAGFTVRDWTDHYGDFFSTVRMEKVMMFIVLSFVIAVASFSIVAGLSMSVDARRRDIAVLRTMGLSQREVLRLFFLQGSLITIAGVVVGFVLGLPLAFYAPELMAGVESVFGFSIIEGTYFDRIPTDPRWPDMVVIFIVATVIGCAATYYPASRAARLHPAEVLRYE